MKKLVATQLHPRKMWVETQGNIPVYHLGDEKRPWTYQITSKKFVDKNGETVLEDPFYEVNHVFNLLDEDTNKYLFEVLTNVHANMDIIPLIDEIMDIVKEPISEVIKGINKPELAEEFRAGELSPGYSKVKTWDKHEYVELLEFILYSKILAPLIVSLSWANVTAFNKENAVTLALSRTKLFALPQVEKFIQYQLNSPIIENSLIEARGLIPEEFIKIGITSLIHWSIRLPMNTDGATYVVGFLVNSLKTRLVKPPGESQIIHTMINTGDNDKENDLMTLVSPGTQLTALESLLVGEIVLDPSNLKRLLNIDDSQMNKILQNGEKIAEILRASRINVESLLLNTFIARIVIPEVHDKAYSALPYSKLGVLFAATNHMLKQYNTDNQEWLELLTDLSVSIKTGTPTGMLAISNMITRSFEQVAPGMNSKGKELSVLYSLIQNGIYSNSITGEAVKNAQLIKPAITYLLLEANDIINARKSSITSPIPDTITSMEINKI